MTAKFTIPPLIPSAATRAAEAVKAFRVLGEQLTVKISLDAANRDGYLAGIDAVIAALREPDEELFRILNRGDSRWFGALADELKRRKP